MKKGSIIFKITTANGAVPLENAKIELSSSNTAVFGATSKNGFSEDLSLDFEKASSPFLSANAKIFCNGYKESFLDDIKIYEGVTTVRIVNLDRI